MQRKNSILKNNFNKSGMAMVMAIAVIVVVATILTLALSLTTLTGKKTTDLYLYEQATLLSHSAAEYAMLKMSQVPACSIESLSYPYNNLYDINTTMQYIPVAGTTCDTQVSLDLNRTRFATITHPSSDGTVILDITVSTKSGISTEPIRYFRRTIQKL